MKKKVEGKQFEVVVFGKSGSRSVAFSKGTLTINPGPNNQQALLALEAVLQRGGKLEVELPK